MITKRGHSPSKMTECIVCKKKIEDDEKLVRVSDGYINEEEFYPTDIYIYHVECYDMHHAYQE